MVAVVVTGARRAAGTREKAQVSTRRAPSRAAAPPPRRARLQALPQLALLAGAAAAAVETGLVVRRETQCGTEHTALRSRSPPRQHQYSGRALR